jgi:hypothetical protein
MSYNLTGVTVSGSYGRLVQVVYGIPNTYYDGFGNLLDLGPGSSSVGPQGPIGPTGPQGLSVNWAGVWDPMMNYFLYDMISYNGNSYIYISNTPGTSVTTPDVDTSKWELMTLNIKGATGSPGSSGESGSSGTSGSSGESGSSGTSGSSGISGSSGTSGSSGESGSSGTSGSSG